MPVIHTVLGWLPNPIRQRLLHHRELVKFAFVGGTSFLVDTAIFIGLKDTVLISKPVTAKIISTLIATIVSYVMNREWSFKTRGGRERHHEAFLFFLVSAIGMGLTSLPLVLSRYGLHLQTPDVSRLTQEVADFVSAQIIGTVIAMVFRWWAFRRFVFPHADVRARAAAAHEFDVDEIAAEMLGDTAWAFDSSQFASTQFAESQFASTQFDEEPDDILDADTDELTSEPR
jgi:putative flippase GtrA